MPKAIDQVQSKRKNKTEAAKWYIEDVEALISTLYANLEKYRTDDNSASFKTGVWSVVAEQLAELHEERPEKDDEGKGRGGPKTVRACADKWKSVSRILLSSDALDD